KVKQCGDSLLTPLPCETEHCLVINGSWESLEKRLHMWLQDVMKIPLVVMVQRINTRDDRVL
ncbi:hypothetical protein TNCV_3655231, partial [Trichonephila clavipes]